MQLISKGRIVDRAGGEGEEEEHMQAFGGHHIAPSSSSSWGNAGEQMQEGHGAAEDAAPSLLPPDISAVQIIPALMQLYPEIEVEHAEDSHAILQRASQGKWTWVFAGRTVYLVGPPPPPPPSSACLPQEQTVMMRVWHHRDIAPLLRYYLVQTQPAASQP